MPTWTFKNRKGTVFKANQQKIEVLHQKFVLVDDFFALQLCFSTPKIAHQDDFCQIFAQSIKRLSTAALDHRRRNQ